MRKKKRRGWCWTPASDARAGLASMSHPAARSIKLATARASGAEPATNALHTPTHL